MTSQRFGHKPVKSFIEFQDAGTSPSGKTRIWNVVNTNFNEVIGTVHWHGAWRKYIYESPLDSIYDWECMRLIADFTESSTKLHRMFPGKAKKPERGMPDQVNGGMGIQA